MKTATLALLACSTISRVSALKYDFEDNGKNWEKDDPDFKACENGNNQSPIDLKSDMTAKEEESHFKHYENVDYYSALSEVKKAHYGQQYFKNGEAFYTTLSPYFKKYEPKYPTSPEWFSNPNYFVSS